MSSRDDRWQQYLLLREESPGSIGQGCRLTAGRGDPKESATENNRQIFGKGEKAG